jgi:chromate transporter
MPVVPTGEVVRLFLRLGFTAFGGPAAHIGLLHHEVVRRRRWIADPEFAEFLALTNLLPGPNSTEMALHVGRAAAGWRGFLAAGLCFIAPAAVMVLWLAILYTRYGQSPDARAVLAGLTPIIVAIIANAVVQMARSTLRGWTGALVAIVTAVLSFAGANELVLLAAAGVLMMAVRRALAAGASLLTLLPAAGVPAAASPAATEFTLVRLGLFFLQVGSVLFGSGYVLIAFLRADLVERWGWLTDRQLVDAVAAGQITPGPLFTTATFVGYLLGGLPGAVISTIAIFAPAFVFVALGQRFLPRIRRSPAARAFLEGVFAASLGLMAAVAAGLGRGVVSDPLHVAVAVVAWLALWRFRVNSVWLIAAGALIGWIDR